MLSIDKDACVTTPDLVKIADLDVSEYRFSSDGNKLSLFHKAAN